MPSGQGTSSLRTSVSLSSGMTKGFPMGQPWGMNGHTSESTLLFWRFTETETGSPAHLRSLLSVKWLHCLRSHPGGTGFMFHIMADPCYCNQYATTENTQTPLLRIPTNKARVIKKTGLPRWLGACQCRCGFHSWVFWTRVRKIPWRRKWQPTPVFLPRTSHQQRSPAGCSPLGHKELDVTEQLSMQRQPRKRWFSDITAHVSIKKSYPLGVNKQ